MWDMILPALATLGGAFLSSNANTSAANTASAADLQAAQIDANAITNSTNAAIAQEQAGLAQTEQQYNNIEAQVAPATGYLRNVMASPTSLTPQQQQQLTQADQVARNQIDSSSIAGSGQAAAGILRNLDLTYINDAVASNQKRADAAASTLYGTGSSAALSSAAAPLAAAGTTANLTSAGGIAAGNALASGTTAAAGVNAAATTANGNVTGSALGSIGNMIAAEGRASRYDTTNANNNNNLVNAINAASGSKGSSQPGSPNNNNGSTNGQFGADS